MDAFNYANPAVGLNVASVAGDIAGTTATDHAAGEERRLSISQRARAIRPRELLLPRHTTLGDVRTADAPGATFTTMLSAPIPNSATPGSLMGVYASGGVEQMVITSAMNFFQPHFKTVAHGILSWATRGVHLGYNRNRLTFHVDDASRPSLCGIPSTTARPARTAPRIRTAPASIPSRASD